MLGWGASLILAFKYVGVVVSFSERVGAGMLDMQGVMVVRLEMLMIGTEDCMMLGKNKD